MRKEAVATKLEISGILAWTEENNEKVKSE
jgi:hypothetical protein